MKRLQAAEKAPTKIKTRPNTQPVRPNTYGNERTPEPMADAERANIDPLSEPLSSLPNVLWENVLMCP
jgi:hypothetical protein